MSYPQKVSPIPCDTRSWHLLSNVLTKEAHTALLPLARRSKWMGREIWHQQSWPCLSEGTMKLTRKRECDFHRSLCSSGEGVDMFLLKCTFLWLTGANKNAFIQSFQGVKKMDFTAMRVRLLLWSDIAEVPNCLPITKNSIYVWMSV